MYVLCIQIVIIFTRECDSFPEIILLLQFIKISIYVIIFHMIITIKFYTPFSLHTNFKRNFENFLYLSRDIYYYISLSHDNSAILDYVCGETRFSMKIHFFFLNPYF